MCSKKTAAMPSPKTTTCAQEGKRFRERRYEEGLGAEEEGLGGRGAGSTREARSRVSEREAGRRPAAAASGQAAPAIATAGGCGES
jgi:hypothetical protein